MTTSTSLVAPHLQAFFTDHLTQHKRASPQTVASLAGVSLQRCPRHVLADELLDS